MLLPMVAGKSEVGKAVGTSVLTGDDMFDFKCRPIIDLRHVAVLAQTAGAFSDKLCQGRIHATSL